MLHFYDIFQFQLHYNIANTLMQKPGCCVKVSKCYLPYIALYSNSTTEGSVWDQSRVAMQFLKISVCPSFLLTVSPPIAPVKPCSVSLAASPLPPVYSISHALWAGFQSCTQISNLSPQPRSRMCGKQQPCCSFLILLLHVFTFACLSPAVPTAYPCSRTSASYYLSLYLPLLLQSYIFLTSCLISTSQTRSRIPVVFQSMHGLLLTKEQVV